MSYLDVLRTLDHAYVDGVHLFEDALRDFVNIERQGTWTTVVAFEDVPPRTEGQAADDLHDPAPATPPERCDPTADGCR